MTVCKKTYDFKEVLKNEKVVIHFVMRLALPFHVAGDGTGGGSRRV